MLQILLQTVIVFISTSIDDLFLLILFQSQAKTKTERLSILAGQYIGIGALVALSSIGSYFAQQMLQDWVIGLLGLIPLLLGIRALVQGESSETEASNKAGKTLLGSVSLVTIASGGDNIGIYIPWFATLGWNAMGIVLLAFIALIAIFWYASILLASQTHIKRLISRFSSILVPLVFILLGFSILSEMGTLGYIFGL